MLSPSATRSQRYRPDRPRRVRMGCRVPRGVPGRGIARRHCLHPPDDKTAADGRAYALAHQDTLVAIGDALPFGEIWPHPGRGLHPLGRPITTTASTELACIVGVWGAGGLGAHALTLLRPIEPPRSSRSTRCRWRGNVCPVLAPIPGGAADLADFRQRRWSSVQTER